MLKTEEVLEDVKTILDLDGTEMYDSKLNFYIPASFNKLKNEGLPNILTKDHEAYQDYLLCLALDVAKYIDVNADVSRIHYLVTERKIVLRETFKNA